MLVREPKTCNKVRGNTEWGYKILPNKKGSGKMQEEIWKSLIEFENLYKISNYGNILNLKTNKYVLKTIDKNCGYVYVNLTKDKKTKKYRLHKLVLRTFKGEPPLHNSVVGHLDNNKTNNYIDNLYWTTTKENTRKAVEDNLMKQFTGAENINSFKIKVLDIDNNILGVYGSLGDVERYIKNITKSYVAKVYKNKDYIPRTKKYKYLLCEEQEFNFNLDKLNKELIENKPSNKEPSIFLVTNLDTNECVQWDNQFQASKFYGIPQAQISHLIKDNKIYKNLKFTFIQKINYKDASAYTNFKNTLENIIIINIFTNEIKIFETQVDLKKFFDLQGHSILEYKKNNQLIHSEWKIL